MLRYRAAVSAIKAVAPEVLFGMPADIDVEDTFVRPAPVVEVREERPRVNPALAVALEEVETASEEDYQAPHDGPQEVKDVPVEDPVDNVPGEDEVLAEGLETALEAAPVDLSDEPVEEEAPAPAPEPPPQRTRPQGSTLQELRNRFKSAGLTPIEQKLKVSAFLGREVNSLSDISAGEAENLLGVKWD